MRIDFQIKKNTKIKFNPFNILDKKLNYASIKLLNTTLNYLGGNKIVGIDMTNTADTPSGTG